MAKESPSLIAVSDRAISSIDGGQVKYAWRQVGVVAPSTGQAKKGTSVRPRYSGPWSLNVLASNHWAPVIGPLRAPCHGPLRGRRSCPSTNHPASMTESPMALGVNAAATKQQQAHQA